MRKLVLLPITLPLALARGAVDGALRAAVDVIADLAHMHGPEAVADDLGAIRDQPDDRWEPDPAEPDLAVLADAPEEELEDAPDVADEEPEAVPDTAQADDTSFPSEVSPTDQLEPPVEAAGADEVEPETPDAVAEELGLPPEELTRGEAAELREREREAETTEDSPGAIIHVDEPWDGYRSMSAPDVVDRLRVADDATKAVVLLYEEQHRARKSILAAARGE